MAQQMFASTAAIATGHPLGAAAGLELLREGGNAVDAAVAAMLAMCVVVPGSVGLGGFGGSAVIHSARSRTVEQKRSRAGAGNETTGVAAVDFDSCAPLAFRDCLVTADAESSYYGARSVTVPAVVAGLDLILHEFGAQSWREVSRPAIRLADEGFAFDAEHQRHFDRCAAHFDRQSLAALFPGGIPPKLGELWKQPQLARLLQRLADEGPRAFYQGDIARSIVRYLGERGGLLTEEDFRSYQPRLVEAVQLRYRDYELYTPPPPSGGITSLAIVQTLEQLLGEKSGEMGARSLRQCAHYFHLLAETMKLCWRERHRYLGDPEFISITLEQLLSEGAADERADKIRHCAASDSASRPPLPAPGHDSPHTANVIAVDATGNLISLTATQGWMYGSHLVVDGMGLVLNHGMSRFDYVPGHPNAPAAGKRMQHNMAPIIALRGKRPAIAFGMPGGPKIVTVTAQSILNTIAFGLTPAESIAAPRLHTAGEEPLLVSQHMPDHVAAELEQFGHTVRREEDMGGPVNVLAMESQTGRFNVASGEATGAVAGL